MLDAKQKAIIDAAREYAHSVEDYAGSVLFYNKHVPNETDAVRRLDLLKAKLASELRCATAERELLRLVFELDESGEDLGENS